MTNETDKALTSSAGHDLSEVAYLDRHFLACQPEYEAMLKSVGLQAGWRVLDAGCGSGCFLPLMSQLLGPSGQIDALDLAPENVTHVETQQRQNVFACPVTARVGSVVNLPYTDDTFDTLWCAAITQYLNDDDLNSMLREFRRVLKPGGLLALKDASMMCTQLQPLDPLFLPRFRQAEVNAGNAYIVQNLRNAELPTWARRAGFQIIRANTVMVERWQPLHTVEKEYLAELFGYGELLATANEYLSDADKAVWAKLADVDSPDHILNHPDFYHSQGHVMVVAENTLS